MWLPFLMSVFNQVTKSVCILNFCQIITSQQWLSQFFSFTARNLQTSYMRSLSLYSCFPILMSGYYNLFCIGINCKTCENWNQHMSSVKQCHLSTANGPSSLPEHALWSTGEFLSYYWTVNFWVTWTLRTSKAASVLLSRQCQNCDLNTYTNFIPFSLRGRFETGIDL